MDFKVEVSIRETGRMGKYNKYSLDDDLAGEMTLTELLEYTKSSLLITADQVLKEELAAGFPKDFVTLVDGVKNKPVVAVDPLGKIEFVSKRDFSEVLLFTYKGLLDRSPVDTGLYKDSHYVFLNGTQVATNLSTLEGWLKTNPEIKDSDKVRIVNIQPYGRKLERFGIRAGERGNIGRRRERKQTKKSGDVKIYFNQPNGAYFVTSRSVASKYKNNVGIKFSFISGGQLGIAGSFKGQRAGKKNRSGRPYLYPSIILSIGEGITGV